MTAVGKQIDPLARALAPVVREMLMAEVERVAASLPVPKPRDASTKADRDIMAACLEVAEAADRLAQAKYGIGEIVARTKLERAGAHLGRVMKKHGRMP
ncbi:hypothetical protein [Mesorhizobium sp. NZP2077]|uniref:hypothetical protein n=1 Tax=Mesorhizobium sp. NZP2077 TaxID=2483404 RepID=UPI001555C76C|nr:hypothetical protein [Mesorhizobium sp. NZP2077]QKC83254.1 hypothetical protein EB232_18000 [Mesorhizobium sp. NZP2077]QKD16770.1 hypothetical protein HGP13_17780 [Mesorhizobium sp. NZP2077]